MQQVYDFLIHHILTISIWLIGASWLSALIGAIIYYVWQYPSEGRKSFTGFFRYILPREILNHRSTRLDVIFTFVNKFTEPFTVVPFFIATASISLLTYNILTSLLGEQEQGPSSLWISIPIIFIILLVQDFSVWLTHFLEHKVPVLWEIHKVHHSLPVMTPISNRRHHPWQLLWEGGVTNILAGMTLGIATYIANVPMLDNVVLGIDAYFIASTLSFYHLRHSHIPLHYGWFEKWFLSPSQHQLHHSYEPQDCDKNFSLLLSIWDRMFGTINYTQPGYAYRIGLPAQYDQEYDSVWKFFVTPPKNIARILFKKRNTNTQVIKPALPENFIVIPVSTDVLPVLVPLAHETLSVVEPMLESVSQR